MTVGCIGPRLRPEATWITGSQERILNKNYEIGSPMVARPGEPIVRVKEYWIQKKYQQSVILDRQLIIKTGTHSIRLPHGRVLTNMGPVDINDVQYLRYVDANDDDGIGAIFYFKPDGRIADFVFDRGGLGISRGMDKILTIEPTSFKLKIKSVTEARPEEGGPNYEILFEGKDEKGIHAIYHEIDPNAVNNPMRDKPISIPAGDDYLRYNNLQVKIGECTREKMAYTVVAD